jgi:hypothetical protein
MTLLRLALAAVLLTWMSTVSTAGERANPPSLRIDWCSTTISATVGGQPITDRDLPGRVVLLIQNGLGADDAWNSFAVKTSMEFAGAVPAGGLVPVFVVDDAKANLAAWTSKGGIATVGFVERKNLHIPGFIWGGAPRFVLVDADGTIVSDMIIDGRDLSGGSRYQSRGILMKPDDVRRTVDAGPGPLVPAGSWSACKAEVEALTAAAVTSKPLAPVLKSLRDRSKGSDKAEALKLLDAVRQHVQRQQAVAERNRATNPLLYKRIIERLQTQLGNDELAKPLDAVAKTMTADKALQAELKAAEDFSLVLRTAAEIGFGVGDPDAPRPADRIKAIRSGLQTVLSRHGKSQTARYAEVQKTTWDQWVAKAIEPLPW